MNKHTALAAALAAGGTLLASVAVAAPATAHMRPGPDSTPRSVAEQPANEDCPMDGQGRPTGTRGERPVPGRDDRGDARARTGPDRAPMTGDRTRSGRGMRPGAPGEAGHNRAALPAADPDGLTDEQAAYLTYLVQEEKMARDLYREFATVYGTRIFTMIAASEQQHMDAVSFLLDRYDIDDPTDTLTAGQFADTGLQDLFDTLLAQGAESEADALAAGVTVEETDLADLADAVDMPADVTATLDRLADGSERHLAAFSR